MADADQQVQESRVPEDSPKEDKGKGTNRPFDSSDVPEHRLEELNRKKKEAEQRAKTAEQRLAAVEQEREQAQEEKAQKQGEYQELANKRQKKIEKLEGELKQVKGEWTRERRMNTWNAAAQGIVKPGAIRDAFQFLSEDDLAGVEDSDEQGYRTLAQNLVEVRDYLVADGVRGAGSGGSRTPVMVGENGDARNSQSGRKQIFKAKRRPTWR